MNEMNKLILASSSPRRMELLAEVETEFSQVSSDVEELHDESMALRDLCEHNAFLKADDIAKQNKDCIVLGADTLVYVDETPLGKPKSIEEARRNLRLLSGRSHFVCTGICLVYNGQFVRFSEVTEVHFLDLSDEMIQHYLSIVNVMDKAGGYAIQDHGELLIDCIKGDLSNVIGLPQEKVKRELQKFRQLLKK